MEFATFVEPQQGATYTELLAFARATESAGFDAFFRSDHYLKMGDRDGLPGPTDAWTTLAGLARETSTIRLGTLVSSATFRHPSILAIQVAQVDEMSGGRVELGLGTGWYREEHEAYGIPFPEKRFGPFEEQLEIITGLWSTPLGETYSFDGKHYTLVDSPALPKPVQSRVPVIVGGGGAKRTPAIAARFATEFNIGFVTEAVVAEKFAGVRDAAASAGRTEPLTLSVALPTLVGRDDAEFARRAAATGRDVTEFRGSGENFAGSPAEVADKVARLRELGADRVYFQLNDMRDLDHIELIASEVLPQLR
ncbi:LLM class F420-dependent oxidoreductase [Marisediminicola sp. LYQ134]|uniref:LLM class F420-dependent oxidoreductase n=1 Tax=unclassified Marisediminicola TaxID=2618316 RepID=UPI003983A106